MKKLARNLFSVVLGIFLIILSVVTKSLIGQYYLIPLILGVIFIVFSALSLLFKKSGAGQNANTDIEKPLAEYKRKSSLLSRSEMGFYEILKSLFADKYLILPQVALVSVVDKLTQTSYRNELFRIIDFCLADKETYAPLLLIELNDSSHNRADRIERDRKVAQICESARMPLITIQTSEINDTALIKKLVNKNALKR